MEFNKKATNISKGLAILLLLFNHLFTCPPPGILENNQINFLIIKGFNLSIFISEASNICVSIFVILSAFGLSKFFSKKHKEISGQKYWLYFRYRYIKLISGFIFIFILFHILGALFFNYNYTIYGENLIHIIPAVIFDITGTANLFSTISYNPTWWYMSIAIVVMFFVPFFYELYKKVSIGIIPIIFIAILIFNIKYGVYIFCCAFGVMASEMNFFEIVKKKIIFNKKVLSKVIKIFIYVGITIISFIFIGGPFSTIARFSGAVAIILFSYEFIYEIPFLNKIFEFYGKHSANIFFTHTFIYLFWFKEFIYSFKSSLLIFLILSLIMLIISIVIELIKKVTLYNKLLNIIYKKLNFKTF